jgi:hypothetical protein
MSQRRGGDLRYDLCRWHFFIKRLVPEVDADPKRPVVKEPGCADVVSLTFIRSKRFTTVFRKLKPSGERYIMH